MSSIWQMTFSVVGDLSRISDLQRALQRIHDAPESVPDRQFRVNDVERRGGILIVEAFRNYGGHASLEALAAEYPDLTFHGLISHEQEVEQYWTFEGRAGIVNFVQRRISAKNKIDEIEALLTQVRDFPEKFDTELDGDIRRLKHRRDRLCEEIEVLERNRAEAPDLKVDRFEQMREFWSEFVITEQSESSRKD